MPDANELDRLISAEVCRFERAELRRGKLGTADRERVLGDTLGPVAQPLSGEKFAIGDPVAGITSKSIWYQSRRIHFAIVTSIAVGEIGDDVGGDGTDYCVDINCTLHRSYRIKLPTIPETDNFITALSQFMSIRIVPTLEDEMRERMRAEELGLANEVDAAARQRRMELLARQQNDLLSTLIQVECAPRISFGMIF